MDTILIAAVLVPAAVVIAALVSVLWRERRDVQDGRVALVTGAVLAIWAATVTILAYRGVFRLQDVGGVPAVGVNLLVVAALLTAGLLLSPSLRSLLTRQERLIRLHLWRLEGFVFLALMLAGSLPALFAVPAGIGDVLIAVTAPWVARDVVSPRGRRRAVIWNLLGMADLVIAVGLGIMTNPGPAHVFHTTPSSAAIASFPLAVVPTFLVPLAFTLHIVSLSQLFGGSWVRRSATGLRVPLSAGAAS